MFPQKKNKVNVVRRIRHVAKKDVCVVTKERNVVAINVVQKMKRVVGINYVAKDQRHVAGFVLREKRKEREKQCFISFFDENQSIVI
jgi:hypothetical protein